ncbi:hypothetical protein EDB83DRAFT_2355453 [Lactarius deliciosus]|nr:hypothetical protein EDB83DRAFT_2355453 [Lactarius deliciosus]
MRDTLRFSTLSAVRVAVTGLDCPLPLYRQAYSNPLRGINSPRKIRRRDSIQMSSSWNMFDNLPGPSIIMETLVSGAKALGEEYQSLHPTIFPAYHSLQRCSEKLQEIKELLAGISEHRRRKIQIASQQGVCLSLESLELDLERLVDNYRDLCRVHNQSSMFQRSFLSKRFQLDIITLERRIRNFYTDSWKTTVAGDRSINWGTMRKMSTT